MPLDEEVNISEIKEERRICSMKLYLECGKQNNLYKNKLNKIAECESCEGFNNKCGYYDPL